MQTASGAPLSTPDPAAASAGAAPTRRITAPAAVAVVLGLGLAVWGADQASKAWALAALVPGVRRPIIGDLLCLQLLFNPGAAFSLGTGVTPLFAAIQAAVAIAIIVAAFRVGSLWWAIGLGCVLGGAAGNLTDRLLRAPGFAHGHVVDFLRLPHWPVFNLADSAICIGAVLLAVASYRGISMRGDRPSSMASERQDAGDAPVAEPPGQTPTEPEQPTGKGPGE